MIEIPPCSAGLAVCLVYEIDPNYFCTIKTFPFKNGIGIFEDLSKKRNVPNETEWSKDHDHVWLHCFLLGWSGRFVIRISSKLLSGDVMHIKSFGVHLINLAKDIPIDNDDCHNGESAAAISELSDAAIPTKRGLQSIVLYDDHPNKRIKQAAADGAGPSNHHP